jgi:L-lactate utilization protein LutC
MSTARESFLDRVRKAVASGNRPGAAEALEPRGSIGYQGAGTDAMQRFGEQLTAAGGTLHPAQDRDAARALVLSLIQDRAPGTIFLGHSTLLDELDLPALLHAEGREVIRPENADTASWYRADIAITGVEYLIAETGTVVMASAPTEPRSLSLLPPVHIALAERRQLLPDLFDLFVTLAGSANGSPLPSCLTLITGPSKTGDIELRLVTGVHGPGEVHVILVQ